MIYAVLYYLVFSTGKRLPMNKLKQLAFKVLSYLPLSNTVLFESAPDLSDNTKPVFDEMLRRNLQKRYRLIWLCFSTCDHYPKIKNVKYLEVSKHKYEYVMLTYLSKVIICCNRFVESGRKGQSVYYLMHGSPIKDTSSYYKCSQYVNYMITAGEYMNKKSALAMSFDEKRCYPLGYPRNDILVHPSVDLQHFLGKYKKYVIWYPTVKQFKGGRDYGIEPIPFFEDPVNIEKINEFAKSKDILIIIKPHFAQIENISKDNYSNIKFINDDFYKTNNLVPYEFMGSCDALLSDYSSVFYDYMICNKPIGLIWADLDTFKKNVGLFDFYEEVTDCCSRIYTLDDLFEFLSDVSDGKDKYQEDREKMCKVINAPKDGKNAARVVDFIVKESQLNL